MIKKWITGGMLCCACIMMLSGIGYAHNVTPVKNEGGTTVKAHVVADMPDDSSAPQPDGAEDDSVPSSGQTDGGTSDGTDVVKTGDVNDGKWWFLLVGSSATILYCGIRVSFNRENSRFYKW